MFISKLIAAAATASLAMAGALPVANAQGSSEARDARSLPSVMSGSLVSLPVNTVPNTWNVLPAIKDLCGKDISDYTPGLMVRCAEWNINTVAGTANYEATSNKDAVFSHLGLRWFSRPWKAPKDISTLTASASRNLDIDWDCSNGWGGAGVNMVMLTTLVTVVNDKTNKVLAQGDYTNMVSCGNQTAKDAVELNLGYKEIGATVGGQAIWPASGGQYRQEMSGGVHKTGLKIKAGDVLRVRFETDIVSGIWGTAWVDFNRVAFQGAPKISLTYS